MNQIQQKKKNLQQPGIEPGPDPWQGPILPLDYYCSEEELKSGQMKGRDDRESQKMIEKKEKSSYFILVKCFFISTVLIIGFQYSSLFLFIYSLFYQYLSVLNYPEVFSEKSVMMCRILF